MGAFLKNEHSDSTGTLLNVMWQSGMGEEFKGEWVHVCVQLSPFAVHFKVLQHC